MNKVKVTDEHIRGIIDYYSWTLSEEIGLIKGLKKFNIDNDEMDEAYLRAWNWVTSCHNMIAEYVDNYELEENRDDRKE